MEFPIEAEEIEEVAGNASLEKEEDLLKSVGDKVTKKGWTANHPDHDKLKHRGSLRRQNLGGCRNRIFF